MLYLTKSEKCENGMHLHYYRVVFEQWGKHIKHHWDTADNAVESNKFIPLH